MQTEDKVEIKIRWVLTGFAWFASRIIDGLHWLGTAPAVSTDWIEALVGFVFRSRSF